MKKPRTKAMITHDGMLKIKSPAEFFLSEDGGLYVRGYSARRYSIRSQDGALMFLNSPKKSYGR